MNNRKSVVSLIVLSLLVLTACSSNYSGSAYNYPPAGTKLILKQTLTVLPGRAGLYIQDGLDKAGKHSRFKPFCTIRFRNVAAASRHIVPDIFIVKNSRVEMRLIAANSLQQRQQEQQRLFRTVSYRLVDSTPSDILEVVTMRVHSPKNPGVFLMECGGVENSPSEVEPPTLGDIRMALGEIMSLQLPAPGR